LRENLPSLRAADIIIDPPALTIGEAERDGFTFGGRTRSFAINPQNPNIMGKRGTFRLSICGIEE